MLPKETQTCNEAQRINGEAAVCDLMETKEDLSNLSIPPGKDRWRSPLPLVFVYHTPHRYLFGSFSIAIDPFTTRFTKCRGSTSTERLNYPTLSPHTFALFGQVLKLERKSKITKSFCFFVGNQLKTSRTAILNAFIRRILKIERPVLSIFQPRFAFFRFVKRFQTTAATTSHTIGVAIAAGATANWINKCSLGSKKILFGNEMLTASNPKWLKGGEFRLVVGNFCS